MLAELVVRDLGVIERAALVFGDGMTAVTGETGAGKTLVVEAIQLLLGARAEPLLVRAGAEEARVDGRFLIVRDDVERECVLTRVIPRNGRSRAYLDGAPVAASVLAEVGARLVDLHGQHGHQSLLSASAQREALDVFGGIDAAPLDAARSVLRDIDRRLFETGGDDRSRAREADLLRFQVRELRQADLADPDEDSRLEDEEDLLSDATAHRETARAALSALNDEGSARDRLGEAVAALVGRGVFGEVEGRLRSVALELDDVASALLRIEERIEDDPERLGEIRNRRQKLRDLCRKYGDDLSAVIAYAGETEARLEDLLAHDERRSALAFDRAAAVRSIAALNAELLAARRAASGTLARTIEVRLGALAMPKARFSIDVRPPTVGDVDADVTFLLAANPGSPPLPLTKVASGGELARIMLALRLGLLESPESKAPNSGPASRPGTLVFDEVDAGIGGQAAVAVGRALSDLATGRQVLVVTHLPQVAAFADHQALVHKADDGRLTRTSVELLDENGRVGELARMLAGDPESPIARAHAAELLAAGPRVDRGRSAVAPGSSSSPQRRGSRQAKGLG